MQHAGDHLINIHPHTHSLHVLDPTRYASIAAPLLAFIVVQAVSKTLSKRGLDRWCNNQTLSFQARCEFADGIPAVSGHDSEQPPPSASLLSTHATDLSRGSTLNQGFSSGDLLVSKGFTCAAQRLTRSSCQRKIQHLMRVSHTSVVFVVLPHLSANNMGLTC